MIKKPAPVAMAIFENSVQRHYINGDTVIQHMSDIPNMSSIFWFPQTPPFNSRAAVCVKTWRRLVNKTMSNNWHDRPQSLVI